MRYLLLIMHDDAFTPQPAIGEQTDAWVDEFDASGVRLMGDRVVDGDQVKTVRFRNEKVEISDGPSIASPLHLVGFDLLECQNMDEAIRVATKHPMAQRGIIEVRSFWQD